jgi:hypothetical protein
MNPRQGGRVLRGMCSRSGRILGYPLRAVRQLRVGGKCCGFPFRQASPCHLLLPSGWAKAPRTTSVDLITGEYGKGISYVDCHLYARLGASALEHHIKPVVLAEYLKEAIRIFSCSSELLLGRFCFWGRGETEDVFSKAVRLREGETGLIDVDGNDTWASVRLCKCTGQQANSADAINEDCLSR